MRRFTSDKSVDTFTRRRVNFATRSAGHNADPARLRRATADAVHVIIENLLQSCDQVIAVHTGHYFSTDGNAFHFKKRFGFGKA